MSVIGFISLKHSPGVTTGALALALAADPQTSVVVELDPAGGDVAARAGMPIEAGLVALASAGRHRGGGFDAGHLDAGAFAQRLGSGVAVVVAPPDAAQAAAAVAAVADRLVDDLRWDWSLAVVDAGRWSPDSPALPALACCDAVLIGIEPSLGGVERVRTGLDAIGRALGVALFVLPIGDHPYRPDQVAEVLDAAVPGALAVDGRGVSAIERGPERVARRCALVRSARTLLDTIGVGTGDGADDLDTRSASIGGRR